MVTNRLRQYLQPSGAPEYYIVRRPIGCIYVTPAEARRLVRRLNSWLCPAWLRVTDIHGSEMWLLASSIELIEQSTLAQRESERRLNKQIESEENEWES